MSPLTPWKQTWPLFHCQLQVRLLPLLYKTITQDQYMILLYVKILTLLQNHSSRVLVINMLFYYNNYPL